MAQSYLDEENEESFDISNQLVPNADAYNPLARYDLTQPYSIEENVNLDENGVNDYLRSNEEVSDIPNLAKLAQAVNAGNLSKKTLNDNPETPINPTDINVTELPPVFSENALGDNNQDIAAPIISKNTPKPVENNLNSDLKRESIKTKEELALDRQPVSEQSLDLSHIGQDLKIPEITPAVSQTSTPEKTIEQRYLELAKRLSDEASNDTSVKDAEEARRRAFIGSMIAQVGGGLGQALASRVGGRIENNDSFAQSLMNYGNEGLKIAQEKAKASATERQAQLKRYLDAMKEQRETRIADHGMQDKDRRFGLDNRKADIDELTSLHGMQDKDRRFGLDTMKETRASDMDTARIGQMTLENRKLLSDMQNIQNELSPTSQRSESLRNNVAKMFPDYADAVQGMSAKDIKDTYPEIAKIVSDKKKVEKEDTKEEQKIRTENRKDRKAIESDLTKTKKLLDDLENAQKMFNDYSKGSIGGTGPLATVGGLTKYTSEKTQDLDAQFKKMNLDTMVNMFAGMSKAVDSDAERRAFEAAQPALTNDDKVNTRILNERINAAKSLIKKQQDALQGIDKQGNFVEPKTVEWNESKANRLQELRKKRDAGEI